MRHLPWIFCFASTCAFAAPIATSVNPIPDLNQDQIQQATPEQSPPTPPAPSQSTAPNFTEAQLLQRPDLLQNALDTALLQENLDNVRLLLPLYDQLPTQQRDPILGEFAHAVLLRADGDYSGAEKRLQNVLDAHPNFAPIRLQLALAQAQNGKTREASQNIHALQQDADLPAAVQHQLTQFDQALTKQRAWQFNFNAYYLQDNNVGRAPEQRTYGFWRFSEPKSAHGLGYEVSAQKTTPIKGHWAAQVNLSAYGKYYWDAHDYDDLIIRADVGSVWRDAKQEWSLSPYFEKRWYGTEQYSHTSGGSLRYSRVLSPKWQVFGAWQSGYTKHEKRRFLDGANHAASLSLLYRTSPYQYFVVGAGAGRNNARDKSDAYHQHNARVVWQRQWGKTHQFTTVASGSVQKRDYQGTDLFNIQRSDTEYFTRLSLSHKKLAWHGITPRLNWTWSHVHSNHFYYRYRQNRVFVDVTKQF